MVSIQAITNNWIDIINLDITYKAIRKSNNDIGDYILDNENLVIIWHIWGKENFLKINNIFYNCTNNFFEIYIDNNEWNDICIFDILNNKVHRKYYPNEYGSFHFDNNELIINWKNWGLERFYQSKNGKVYTNTTFGNIIKDSYKKEIKMLAIVFPQFHEVEENNTFWGHGFTEWTLLKNIPRIVNNELIKQPHQDIGYFNLKNYEHRKYMRVLADKYNIFGFCYYHYWFKNKKVMYEPTELMLLDGEPNKPFLFCWANEQWTKRWDGGNNEILITQEYTDLNGNIEHFNYLLQFFKHSNYIKKNNKPIFIFYRIEEKDLNDIKNIITLWTKLSIENGFNGIHFMKFLGPFNNNIFLDEINGYVEFEPGYCTQKNYQELSLEDTISNKIFDEYNEELYLKKNVDVQNMILDNKYKNGYEHFVTLSENEKNIRKSKFFIYDGIKLYDKIIELKRVHHEQHRGICVTWNNTPRRNYNNEDYGKYPHYYKDINPDLFGNNVKKLLEKIHNDSNNEDDFIFISAWNEWNEQAMLEPNNEDGYEYLSELSNAYLSFYNNPTKKNILNICHYGGGTEKYMNDLKKIFTEYNFINFKNFNYDVNYNELYKNIDFIHINSILFNDLKNNYLDFFCNFLVDVKKYITIHDYQWIFPNDPNILKDNLFLVNPVNINSFEILLSSCSKIIFPSNNIYHNYNIFINLEKYKDKIYIINHCDKIINHNFLYIPQIHQFINIAFVGYFIEYKGSNLFKNIASKYIYFNNYIIKYHIFGTINNSNIENENNNIIIHNTYNDNNIIDILHSNNIHGIMHLSLFEESYCYALTNSINSGIPIIYIDRGSISERLIKNDKYFNFEMNNLNDVFNNFLSYIIENNNTYNIYSLNNKLQPNKWYLENYN